MWLALVLSAQASPDGQAGRVIVWGYNALHQGKGETPAQIWTGAVEVSGDVLTNAVLVSAGTSHALALLANGTVAGAGWNRCGQATGVASVSPDTTNGLVMLGGQVLREVVAVAAGRNFSLGLKRDGTLVCWGENSVPSGLSNVVAIAAGGSFSVALKSDGTVLSWCSEPRGEAHVPAGLSNVVAVASGGENYERSMALKRDGTVVVWKAGLPSEEPVPPEVRDVVAITAGDSHSLALKRDGTVFGFGFNGDGQATGVPTKTPPNVVGFTSGLVSIGGTILSNVVAVAAAGRYSLALKGDGTVVAWGDKRYRGVPGGLGGVVAIAVGGEFCLAVATNSSAWPPRR
jgi:alpha-tubulin suppressor-like RCC1 family protein